MNRSLSGDKRRRRFVLRPILHRYANEDVSLGAWFIGLDVEHVDEHSMCCGTPPGREYFDSLSFLHEIWMVLRMIFFLIW